MKIQSPGVNQLITGLSIATSEYRDGHDTTQILAAFQPIINQLRTDQELTPVLQHFHPLIDETSLELSPEQITNAFYQAAQQLHIITATSQPRISLLAKYFREDWSRGIATDQTAEVETEGVGKTKTKILEAFQLLYEDWPEPMGVVEWDEQGNAQLLVLNRVNRELQGLNEEQIKGLNVLKFFYPDDEELIRNFVKEFGTEGQARLSNVRVRRKTGGHYLVDMYAARIEDTRYAYFQMINETEREEAINSALRAAVEAQKADLFTTKIAGMVHDANNHLTGIRGALDFLEMSYPEDDSIRRYAASSVDLLSQMLISCLKVAEPKKRDEEGTDWNTVLSEQQAQMMTKGIERETGQRLDMEIQLNLAESPNLVEGPELVLHQISSNFIKNAIEAMAESPQKTLTISTDRVTLADDDELRRLDPNWSFRAAKPGDYMRLTIEDTGAGIHAEHVDKIFERNFTTKTSKGKPRGIGMASSMLLVEERGGLITVHSVQGKGTRFEIYLPRIGDESNG